MAEEAAVLRRQHRLDQVVGQFVDRHGIFMDDAAVADLVAVAIEECDGEVALGAPVALGFLEGGKGKREQQDEAGRAEIHPFAGNLEDGLLPAFDVEAAGEDGDLLPDLAQAKAGIPDRGIDPGIDAQEDMPLAAAGSFRRLAVVFHGSHTFGGGGSQPACVGLTSSHHGFIR